MANKSNTAFTPTVAIPPGETIAENIASLGLNQQELAKRLGISEKHLSHIINGKAPITYETALGLEKTIGPSAQFWLNLESNFQLHLARLRNEASMEKELDVLRNIPYKEMANLNWVTATKNKAEQIQESRSYYGVSNLTLIEDSYQVAFRKQKQLGPISDLGVIAWLRKAELDGIHMNTLDFTSKNLEATIPELRNLSTAPIDQVIPILQKICSECGIALVVLPYLAKTYICGATIWRKKKPIVAISSRGKRIDTFWFTLFHEFAHLLLHGVNHIHIHYEHDAEDEANALATDLLVPNDLYRDFVEKRPYQQKQEITGFARRVGVAPGIIVGRLQHDGLLAHSSHRDLLELR